MINSNSFDDNNDIINQQNDYKLIDKIDQRLIDLLIKSYTNKKIALEAGSPLSTIQRRIRKIFENEYIHRKNELNHRKLGLRKGYLLIGMAIYNMVFNLIDSSHLKSNYTNILTVDYLNDGKTLDATFWLTSNLGNASAYNQPVKRVSYGMLY